MPRGILDVVRVDRAMGFELPPAVLVLAGVVQRDPSLPQLRRRRRHELHERVKARGRFGDAASLEVSDRFLENRPWLLRRERNLQQKRSDQQLRRHFRRSTDISVSSFRAKRNPSDRAGYARTVPVRIFARATGLNPSGDAGARTSSPFSRRMTSRSPASVTVPAPNRSSLQRTFPVRSSTARRLCPNSWRPWKPYRIPSRWTLVA